MSEHSDPSEVALAKELQAQANRIWQACPLRPSRAQLERRVRRRARLSGVVTAGGWMGVGIGLTCLVVLGLSPPSPRTSSFPSLQANSPPMPQASEWEPRTSSVPPCGEASRGFQFCTGTNPDSHVPVVSQPGKSSPFRLVRPVGESSTKVVPYTPGMGLPTVPGPPASAELVTPTYSVEQLEQKNRALEERINQRGEPLQQPRRPKH